ncbi:MAG: hypothetical protein ACOH2A_14275 [Sphingobacteriaceae bacterium]
MRNNTTALIRHQEASLAKVGRKISITNKLLAISNDNKFIDFFLNNTELIALIHRFYSFKEKSVNQYQWNWACLSDNPNLEWTQEFIEKYADKWSWRSLINNKGIKWTEDSVKKIEKNGFVGLDDFSCCETLLWTEEIIDRYENEIEWYWNWQDLSRNPALPWSIEFFEKYYNKWDWSGDGLSSNPNLPWTIEFIRKYEEKWDWCNLSANEGLPWSIELIETYLHKWDYLGLIGNNSIPESMNPVVKLINLISFDKKDEFKEYSTKFTDMDYWAKNYKHNSIDDNWYSLCKNIHIIWTPNILHYYRLNWGWGGLSANKGLQWSIEFIETFKHMWDYTSLSNNKIIWDTVFKAHMNDNIVNEIVKRTKKTTNS